ncbi:MAG: methyltransferase domain-containing protein [Patescibacteria group bacterium]|nr:methyltransferase domain-containing protein [Patescibacteria group bacterium]MDD5554445.1 methyltransferase domain-containing protein [Patescibacteria group bacterium]
MKLENYWKDKFSEMADSKNEDYEISIWSKEGLEAYIKYFLQYFKPCIKGDNSQMLVLDIGCGPGVFSKILARQGFKIYGVDFSPGVIKVAERKSENLNINYQVASIYNLPFTDNYFDKIICLGVLQTVEDHETAISEMRRVLKKDGLLTIHTLNRFSLFPIFRKSKRISPKRYNPFNFRRLLKENNFFEVKLKGIYFFPGSLNFLTDFILKYKIFKVFNLLFPVSMFLSHSFYIEGRKK